MKAVNNHGVEISTNGIRLYPPTRLLSGRNAWYSKLAVAQLTHAQRKWLVRTGSLTAHLGRLGQVRVEVLSQKIEDITWDEACYLGLTKRQPVWARDVLLLLDDCPVVFAHSLCALRHSHGPWKDIRQLKARPLAELLYNNRAIERTPLVSRMLKPGDGLYTRIHQALPLLSGSSYLPARRSVFLTQHAPLLVMECFLPAFRQKLNEQSGRS